MSGEGVVQDDDLAGFSDAAMDHVILGEEPVETAATAEAGVPFDVVNSGNNEEEDLKATLKERGAIKGEPTNANEDNNDKAMTDEAAGNESTDKTSRHGAVDSAEQGKYNRLWMTGVWALIPIVCDSLRWVCHFFRADHLLNNNFWLSFFLFLFFLMDLLTVWCI